MSIQSLPAGKTSRTSQTILSQPKFSRCVGRFIARDQLARDVACLLDFEDAVSSWNCRSLHLRHGFDTYSPDFVAERQYDVLVIDVIGQRRPPQWVSEAVTSQGFTYRTMSRGDIDPIRLRNCKDLLQCSGGEVSLGDRVRLLSVLDQHYSLTLAESLSVFQESKPILGLANMVVGRFIEIDLDTALIGPETVVRRYRG
ncbi:hypothetical protein LAC81_27085 [Ensifer adhaerens]|uniref:hypothetical protein n=1 Tax=Ensifer adhaerens TaxID=106592 RepID=UPI001CC0D590|nr:hypothetical protein [Ensifer adhaerens]MBZ7924396.1 hypothetical protein [Ensifer adhaerens]UAX96358.1 hypothetical protein LAC78_21400 [Ensifer adhaerens]UAY04299.1 hypothetical protein LAC80_23560 [Ensifer adhaerens]UAY12285.1 hypothetical protein LAC81_27085 [Ensifer adhaerens]